MLQQGPALPTDQNKALDLPSDSNSSSTASPSLQGLRVVGRPEQESRNDSAAGSSTPKPSPTAGAAQARRRRIKASFLAMVVLPVTLIAGYLGFVAQNRFGSEMSFSVRSEEFRSPMEFFASLGQFSSGTTADAEILNEFIESQTILEELESKLNLREIFEGDGEDPVFQLQPDATVEELRDHWKRQVSVVLEKSSGVLQVESIAFTAEDAQAINMAILDACQTLVDRMSRIARDDATRYAEEDLERAVQRLRSARQKFAVFRAQHNVIDPRIDVQNQGGILSILQQQLVEALISYDMIRNAGPTDPRVEQAERRIESIREQISAERNQSIDAGESDLVNIVGDYEGLALDQKFAEEAYVSASAALDSARAEASRRSKYLAVHIEPTLADSGQYPHRIMIVVISAVLLLLFWSVVVMVAYAIRDRR